MPIVPTEAECLKLLAKYRFPEGAWTHVTTVAAVAVFLAEELKRTGLPVRTEVVRAAALLHDLGKSPGLPRDVDHATSSARVVAGLGYTELVEPIRRHIVHSVLDPESGPRTLEEKLVYYADKLVARDYVGLAARFKDLKRRYPQDATTFDRCRPLVEAMEEGLFAPLTFRPADLPGLLGI
ncbi:MAG: HD domain-containing protein [Bacillota bacterium]